MRIRNSLVALFIQRIYNEHNNAMGKATKRISLGTRINSAADDAAGLAISEKVRARINSLSAAMRSGEDGVSLIQTAEGALASVHAMLQRMRELAVQAASDTNDDTDRGALDKEYQQLLQELNDIARLTRFNGRLLLCGLDGMPLSLSVQTGPDAGDMFVLTLDAVTPAALGIDGTHVRSRRDSAAAVTGLGGAIDEVSMNRAALGAAQARLNSRLSSMEMTAEALADADSRIRDADIVEEMVRLTQAQLLARTSAAMMAQSNILANSVLYLLSKQTMAAQPDNAADSVANSAAARADGAADKGTAPSGGAETTDAQTAGKRQTVREGDN
jgi:flagellin